jgi:hypothetical protein
MPATGRRLHVHTREETTARSADVTDILPRGSGAQIQAIALRRRTVERRREALENLRRLAVQLEAASTLDHQADRSNPTLAAVLRERAEERRRIAAVVRAHLDGEVGSTDLSRVLQDGSPGGRRGTRARLALEEPVILRRARRVPRRR